MMTNEILEKTYYFVNDKKTGRFGICDCWKELDISVVKDMLRHASTCEPVEVPEYEK